MHSSINCSGFLPWLLQASKSWTAGTELQFLLYLWDASLGWWIIHVQTEIGNTELDFKKKCLTTVKPVIYGHWKLHRKLTANGKWPYKRDVQWTCNIGDNMKVTSENGINYRWPVIYLFIFTIYIYIYIYIYFYIYIFTIRWLQEHLTLRLTLLIIRANITHCIYYFEKSLL